MLFLFQKKEFTGCFLGKQKFTKLNLWSLMITHVIKQQGLVPKLMKVLPHEYQRLASLLH